MFWELAIRRTDRITSNFKTFKTYLNKVRTSHTNEVLSSFWTTKIEGFGNFVLFPIPSTTQTPNHKRSPSISYSSTTQSFSDVLRGRLNSTTLVWASWFRNASSNFSNGAQRYWSNIKPQPPTGRLSQSLATNWTDRELAEFGGPWIFGG